MISLPMAETYSINDYAHSFTTYKRDDGSTIIKHEEETADFYRKVTYEAHHGEMPDDWVYETCSHCADELNSGERDFYAIAERACDPYTGQLINWLPGNTHWFDDAIDELRDQESELTFWSVATEAQRLKAMQILCTIAHFFEIEPE